MGLFPSILGIYPGNLGINLVTFYELQRRPDACCRGAAGRWWRGWPSARWCCTWSLTSRLWPAASRPRSSIVRPPWVLLVFSIYLIESSFNHSLMVIDILMSIHYAFLWQIVFVSIIVRTRFLWRFFFYPSEKLESMVLFCMKISIKAKSKSRS